LVITKAKAADGVNVAPEIFIIANGLSSNTESLITAVATSRSD
jgi:hypothetical protein